MPSARVAIVGGGLSGLYAAYLLEKQGVEDYVLLEARTALGGRILSAGIDLDPPEASLTNERDRFDLGPTWFWPTMQPELDRLISELRLDRFEQYDAGDMLVEQSPHHAALRVPGYAMSPTSMRLVGGMKALIDALREKLPPRRLITDRNVHRLRRVAQHVELDVQDSQGKGSTWLAEQVLLAIPPRLAATRIEFEPALPDALAQEWKAAPTWMAAHAKYVAVYDTPFWREQGLAGEARSMAGPLAEIHDASMPGGHAALFGFLGLPARMRRRLTGELLRMHCRAQLARIFGPSALHPVTDVIKDWAADPLTATDADQDGMAGHEAAPAPRASSGAWRESLVGIASEWSPRFPGYVAGAIDAADLGVRAMTLAATTCASGKP